MSCSKSPENALSVSSLPTLQNFTINLDANDLPDVPDNLIITIVSKDLKAIKLSLVLNNQNEAEYFILVVNLPAVLYYKILDGGGSEMIR